MIIFTHIFKFRELRGRILSIEHADQERRQRRGSVDSTASYLSHFSATRYNHAYLQIHQDYSPDPFNKRKLNEVEISSEVGNISVVPGFEIAWFQNFGLHYIMP
jgi:hypothetical protein